MRLRTNWRRRLGFFCMAGMLAVALVRLNAGQAPAGQVAIDPDDIGGTVTGPKGPEAGVWVIAESDSLPTKFRKIVVTDDQGRFLLPDLPRAQYRVWVRGYGLVDSTPVNSAPGRTLRLTAVTAPTPQAAAKIYPPNYWYSLIEVPKKSEFPGSGEQGNGISPNLVNQAEWIASMKLGCSNCHQLGNIVMRSITHLKGNFKTSKDAWAHRMQVGQRQSEMLAQMSTNLGRERGLTMFASWTDRIAAGEVPPQPPRPEGVERNLVLTSWDWGSQTSIIHDLAVTDKRKPTVNAGGLVYGLDYGRDMLTVLDPLEGKSIEMRIPIRDDSTPAAFPQSVRVPSPFWEDEIFWTNPANPHNPQFDGKGRVWMTTQIRAAENQPKYCLEGSSHPSAKFFPVPRSGRQMGYFDPKTQKFELIDTCTGTHHLQFDTDADDTVYFTSVGNDGLVGWINTKVYDQTKDAAKAHGWCPLVLDTNGDGKAGPFVEDPTGTDAGAGVIPLAQRKTRRAVTPGQDLRFHAAGYGVIVNHVDHSVWGAAPGPFPGLIFRTDPKTCITEVYEPPVFNAAAPDKYAFGPRGIDVDTNGLIWTALAGSGHTASFDRRKCKVLNGPTATGQHCPDGWTLYPTPGPTMKGVTEQVNADFHYYNFVDQFNVAGLGANIPITTGTTSDSLIATIPQTGKTVVMRVPYPLGFHTRGLDARIDDPRTGWKGRGLWATNANGTLWHSETGKGTRSQVVQFQFRPDPLAK